MFDMSGQWPGPAGDPSRRWPRTVQDREREGLVSTGGFGWVRAVLGAPPPPRRLARAELLTLAGDLTGALAVIDGVLLGLPDTAQVAAAARFDRAELLAELGRPAEALAGYEQVLARCTPRESQSRAPSRQRLALVLSA